MALPSKNSFKKRELKPVYSKPLAAFGRQTSVVAPVLLTFFSFGFSFYGQEVFAKAILFEETKPIATDKQTIRLGDQAFKEVASEREATEKFEAPKARARAKVEKGTLSGYTSRRDYLNLYELKSHRRMGIGAEVLGRLGMVGITMDLNFHPKNSATAGIGAGPQYFSYSLGYRRTLDDRSLSPYLGLAATRLVQSSDRPIKETLPAWIGDYFLKDTKSDGAGFQRTFLSPQLGVQYTQFYGSSAGATMYMEILFMWEASSRKVAPIAGLGMMYYL